MSEDDRPPVRFFEKDFTFESLLEDHKDLIASVDLFASHESDAAEEDSERLEEIDLAAWEELYASSRTAGNVYKDRRYVLSAFPCLTQLMEEHVKHGTELSVFEIGSGAGASLLPIAREAARRKCRGAFRGFDPSGTAVEYLNERFLRDFEDTCVSGAFTLCDGARYEVPPELIGSQSVVVVIFTLSAVRPAERELLMRNARKLLRPVTGRLIFRDHGMLDMKHISYLKEVSNSTLTTRTKADGTRASWFSIEYVERLLRSAGFDIVEAPHYSMVGKPNRKGLVMKRVFVSVVASASSPV